MDHQNQKTEDNSTAIQSGRDTNIVQNGLSAEQMTEVLKTLSSTVQMFKAEAEETVDRRLTEFKNDLLPMFLEDGKADSAAFKDPDFLFVLKESQEAYVRTGDEGLRGVLVDLISRRSRASQRNRLSLTLNDALKRAYVLTSNEYAELSIVYLTRYTQYLAGTPERLARYLTTYISPFLPDISRERASYQYLEAQACASMQISNIALMTQLRSVYGGIFSTGMDEAELKTYFPEGREAEFATSELVVERAGRYFLTEQSKESVVSKAIKLQFSKEEAEKLWRGYESSIPNGDDFLKLIRGIYPEIDRYQELWNDTPMSSLSLTTLGIAVGHANLVQKTGLDPDLSIWIN